MWSVTVDAQKVSQLRQHDWSFIGPHEPFLRHSGAGDPFRIRMVRGRCFFLDEHNRCHIHETLGYDAKPEGCKAFPLHVSAIEGTYYARLSFYCPSVVDNAGKRLDEQMRWVRAVCKNAGDVTRHRPLELVDGSAITSRELAQLEGQLEDWLRQDQHPVADRLAAGAALLAQVAADTPSMGQSATSGALKDAHRRGLQQMAVMGRRDGRAAHAGPILALFLGSDCAPRTAARLGQFFRVRLFNLGWMALRSHSMSARASLSQIGHVLFRPSPAGDVLLTRYLVHKLRGRRHLHGELSLLAGFNLLVVAYAVIAVLARLKAASQRRSEVSDDDLRDAIQAADLLVLEHATLSHKPAFAALIRRMLGDPSLCACLLARLEA